MAELHISKKNSKPLGDIQGKKPIITDYQRPSNGNIEKCKPCGNDIENLFQSEARTGADYFLGTIVTFISYK